MGQHELPVLGVRGREGTGIAEPGVWPSPPQNLTSNLTVYLEHGAVLKADTRAFTEGTPPPSHSHHPETTRKQ